MADLLDEISHDIKKERYDRIVYRITKAFLVLVVLTLTAVIVYVWKENTSDKLQRELSVLFNQALLAAENNQLEHSIKYFNDIIQHPSQQYAGLAYLNKAAILIRQEKFDEAQKTLLEVNEHKNIDLSLRELAQIVFLSNQVANNKIGNAEINKELFNKLTKEDKPWRLLALQIQSLHKINENKFDEARTSLESILQATDANKITKDITSSILSSIMTKNLQK